MSALPQLRLVSDPAPGYTTATSREPARRIFEHWVFMSGRSIRRCKMGPTRAGVILAALSMGYDEDMLMMAIEGMAADPLADCDSQRMRDAMREIEWFMAREARIERWAERGERLRALAITPAHPPADTEQPPTAEQQAEAQAARQRLQAMAQRLRAGRPA